MNLEVDIASERKATVTFDSGEEYRLLAENTPWWSKLHYRRYRDGNSSLMTLLFPGERIIGGKVPETFPRIEVIRDGVLAHAAGALLLKQTYRPPKGNPEAEQVLMPILNYLEMRQQLALAATELAGQSTAPNPVPFNQEAYQ